jgi:hypothetical protein
MNLSLGPLDEILTNSFLALVERDSFIVKGDGQLQVTISQGASIIQKQFHFVAFFLNVGP